jgi:dihydrofolate reductase
MRLALIVATAKNNVIGINNQLPWHLPADLKHFKHLTLHKPVIMGRKTYESIGKALPQRRNIVVTRDKNLSIPDCEIAHSLAQALELTKNSDEVMIIGGSSLFKEALPLAEVIYLTRIDQNFAGDTYFPELNLAQWQEVARIDCEPDDKNPYFYSFLTYERLNP